MYSYYIIFAHKKLERPANTFKKRQQKPFVKSKCTKKQK